MANPNQVVGQARIKVDGDTLDTEGESTLELGGPVREAQRGDYQAGAFSEKTAESKLTVKILVNVRLQLLLRGRRLGNSVQCSGQLFVLAQFHFQLSSSRISFVMISISPLALPSVVSNTVPPSSMVRI